MSLYPLEFTPLFQNYLWGGCRLRKTLGKPTGDRSPVAESWEIVDHGNAQSVVQNGPLAGKTLSQLVQTHRQALLGRHAERTSFPLLLKYLDCNRVLSVQVHPDDAYAQKMAVPDLGKTEAWYVIDAQPNSRLYAGLREGITRENLQEAIESGQTEHVLNQITPMAGDCIFIPAGTVHALGSGLLVAEIQQASNTTFRLFDWNRVDLDGKPRPLHIESALEVTDFQRGPVGRQCPKRQANRWERLVDCEHFILQQYRDSAEQTLSWENRFTILTVPSGVARLEWSEGTISMPQGKSVLLPAAVSNVRLIPEQPETTILAMYLPDDASSGSG